MFRGILKSTKEEKKKMESQGNGAVAANSGKSLVNRRRANKERKMDLLQDV